MGKGDGSGEGWGEGEGKGTGEGWGEGEGQGTGAGMGAAEWKHGLFGCASDGGNRKNFLRSKLITKLWRIFFQWSGILILYCYWKLYIIYFL